MSAAPQASQQKADAVRVLMERHSQRLVPSSQFPYAVSRTWHLQLGIFWIATSWLATGLYVAPAVSGHEPRGQRLGVNLLFGALVLVVGGSLAGEWLGSSRS